MTNNDSKLKRGYVRDLYLEPNKNQKKLFKQGQKRHDSGIYKYIYYIYL